MFPLRSLMCSIVCAGVAAGAVACGTPVPSAPTTPPVLGTTVLAGTVLNAQTRLPIAGALVTVNVEVAAPSTRSAVTADDGSFRIDAVLIGFGTIRVEAEGYLQASQAMNLLGAEVRTEFALVPNGPPPPPPPPVLTLMGGLVTSRQTNLPINGATVSFTLHTGERFTGTTGIDGQFVLTGVPVGVVGDLRVAATGHRTEDQRFTVEPNLFVTVGLDQG